MVHRLARRDIPTSIPDDDAQLDLVVNDASSEELDLSAVLKVGGRRFQEEEGLGRDLVAELGGVSLVVAEVERGGGKVEIDDRKLSET
jgi:hypothetical protein